MSLHSDLLDQAERLATLDPRRPKQVNLRRAVSAVYYALFHLLTSEASALYATEPVGWPGQRVVRVAQRQEVWRVAPQPFSGRGLPAPLAAPPPGQQVVRATRKSTSSS
jgi:hypothetical protein